MKKTRTEIKTYASAVVVHIDPEDHRTTEEETLQIAKHGTTGATPKDKRGNVHIVMYYHGVGWVSPAIFYRLEDEAEQKKEKRKAHKKSA